MGARNIMDGFNTIHFEKVDNFISLVKWGNISVAKSIQKEILENNIFQTKDLNDKNRPHYKVSPTGFLQFEDAKGAFKQSKYDGDMYISTIADELIIDFKATVYKGWIKLMVCVDIKELNFNFSMIKKLHKEQMEDLIEEHSKNKKTAIDKINTKVKSKLNLLQQKYEDKFSEFREESYKEYETKLNNDLSSERKKTDKYKRMYDILRLKSKEEKEKEAKKNQAQFQERLDAEKKHFEERLQLQEKKSKVDNELQFEMWKAEQLIVYNKKLAEEFKKYAKITEI